MVFEPMRIKTNYLIMSFSAIIIVSIAGFVITFSFLENTNTQTPPIIPPVSEIEVDAYGNVYYIVDGDTYDQNGISGIGDRVRLADVDSPESYEAGYQEAKDWLYDTIYGKNVYLDIDDIYGTDCYDRWVGVVYIRYNSTHCLNVNYALVLSGNAVIDNYYNEFNPYSWKLYYYHPI